MLTQKKKSILKTNLASPQKRATGQPYVLLNNRPASISQRRLSTTNNNSSRVKQLERLKNAIHNGGAVIQKVTLPDVERTPLPTSHALDVSRHWSPTLYKYAPEEVVRSGGSTHYPKDVVNKGNNVQTCWNFYNDVAGSANWADLGHVGHHGQQRFRHTGWNDDMNIRVVVDHDANKNTQTLVTTYPTAGRNARITWDNQDEAAEKQLYTSIIVSRRVKKNKKVAQIQALHTWVAGLNGTGAQPNASTAGSKRRRAWIKLTYNNRAAAETAMTYIEANKPNYFATEESK